jgi:hypothetical protein
MKIFSVEIAIAATVYVTAESEDEAVRKVRAFNNHGGEFRTELEFIEGLPVSSARFGSPNFPEISISPAVTVHSDSQEAYLVDDEDDQ